MKRLDLSNSLIHHLFKVIIGSSVCVYFLCSLATSRPTPAREIMKNINKSVCRCRDDLSIILFSPDVRLVFGRNEKCFANSFFQKKQNSFKVSCCPRLASGAKTTLRPRAETEAELNFLHSFECFDFHVQKELHNMKLFLDSNQDPPTCCAQTFCFKISHSTFNSTLLTFLQNVNEFVLNGNSWQCNTSHARKCFSLQRWSPNANAGRTDSSIDYLSLPYWIFFHLFVSMDYGDLKSLDVDN